MAAAVVVVMFTPSDTIKWIRANIVKLQPSGFQVSPLSFSQERSIHQDGQWNLLELISSFHILAKLSALMQRYYLGFYIHTTEAEAAEVHRLLTDCKHTLLAKPSRVGFYLPFCCR